RVDSGRREAERGSADFVTNIFCENALETALQFRDRAPGTTITALSFGPESAEDTLRKALAMKADAAALVVSDSVANPDPLAIARVLAAAIRKLGSFDLILTGREAGDWGAGQTGALLAEELGLPCISFADSLDLASDGRLRVKRQTESGWEVLEAQTPVVVTITNDEHNVPRIPKVRDVMMAHRQPLTQWTLADLGVGAENEYYDVVSLSIPQKDSHCELVAGDTLDQKVEMLAQRLLDVTASV
ncbi:MAG: electron transfer flavoprotein subunit beta/FixA family protein, partial [Acidobacteriota bacterium]